MSLVDTQQEPDLSLVIPFLNEEESLVELTNWITKVCIEKGFSYEIIYIDDGSSDGSWNLIERLAKENHRIKGIRFRRNYGKSAALFAGFEKAQGRVVFTMDSDLQDSPDEIPEMYRMIREEGYDLVSGWKKKRHDPIEKTWPSKLFNATARVVSGIKLHDFNCGLKAYRREVIKSIEVYGEMHRYIPIIAGQAGFKKIGEKVVLHRERAFGHSKFGAERYVKGFLDLLSLTFISKFGKRPMHFFGSMGTVMFVSGFAIALYLAYAKFFNEGYRMTERPLFYFGLLAMVLGTQLFTAGFLGEMISRTAPDRNKYLIDSELNT